MMSSRKQKVKLTIKLDNNNNNNLKSLASPLLPPTEPSTSPMNSPSAGGDSDVPMSFSTTLPPRKRARTKEEKEQRRIERILRNRRAAHLSREKKKKYIEFLENGIIDLIDGVQNYRKVIDESIINLQNTNQIDKVIIDLKNLKYNQENGITKNGIVLNNENFDRILDKINQSKNMNISNNNNNKEISNPNTPILSYNPQNHIPLTNNNKDPQVINQTINTYLKTQQIYSNPSTPRTGHNDGFGLNHSDIDSDVDAANSLKKLSQTPISTTSKIHYNNNSVNLVPINLSSSGNVNNNNNNVVDVTKSSSNTSSTSSSSSINGLGIILNQPSGQLLNMNPKIDKMKLPNLLKNSDEEENDAIRIMMSLKNGKK